MSFENARDDVRGTGQQGKVKFQDQLFAKFQDNFRTLFDNKQLNTHSKGVLFSLTKLIHEHQY